MVLKHKNLFRWHIWLGWLVGVPLIIWTASGLFMVSRPIDEVRGNHLRAESEQIFAAHQDIALFADRGKAVKNARLVSQKSAMVWIVEYEDGSISRFDAANGKAMAPLTEQDARAAADAVYAPAEPIQSARYFAADEAPLDLRRNKASWQVRFADDTNVYVDAHSGETLAVRTKFWRAFDFMWGLHIMDLQTREDTNHPILIGSAALALLGSILGFSMLFTRRRKRSNVRE